MACSAASLLFQGRFSEEILREKVSALRHQLSGKATLGIIFVSHEYLGDLEEVVDLVRLHGHVPEVVGCTGAGLVGVAQEAEMETGISVLLLHLPETQIYIREFSQDQIQDSRGADYWHRKTGLGCEEVQGWLTLFNPFHADIDKWLKEWNVAYPKVPCIGGLASAAASRDSVAVFHNGKRVDGLAVGFSGRAVLRGVVSQGCRPIGEPLTITRADHNLIYNIGASTAYEALDKAFSEMSPEDRQHAKGNLFVGIAMSEYVEDYKRGDFLIRNILGADPDAGVVVIGDHARSGQTVQFQLRDAQAAHEDLQEMLKRDEELHAKPFASLIFTCTGRGQSLFNKPNHDAEALAQTFGKVSNAGFFCNGEVGPVGERNFIHGYTASIALFSEGEAMNSSATSSASSNP